MSDKVIYFFTKVEHSAYLLSKYFNLEIKKARRITYNYVKANYKEFKGKIKEITPNEIYNVVSKKVNPKHIKEPSTENLEEYINRNIIKKTNEIISTSSFLDSDDETEISNDEINDLVNIINKEEKEEEKEKNKFNKNYYEIFIMLLIFIIIALNYVPFY